jgi:hypothetical protein
MYALTYSSLVAVLISLYPAFLDPKIGSPTLCPYCDRPFPARPTRQLLTLLQTIASHPESWRESRPDNPLALRAPSRVYVGLCQRHEFENKQIRIARASGWPEKIDWKKLPMRIKKLYGKLKPIVDDDGGQYSADAGGRPENIRQGPREQCVFWREVNDFIKKSGASALSSIGGQYQNFHNIQPG